MGGENMGSIESFEKAKSIIPDKLFFRIGDVAEILNVKPYVLRYWETEFKEVTPEKSSTGQRVYKRGDVENLLMIKHLLYNERYSIEGARKRIKDLKKNKELKDYKQENVLKSEPVSKNMQASFKDLRKLAMDIQKTASVPVRELFRY